MGAQSNFTNTGTNFFPPSAIIQDQLSPARQTFNSDASSKAEGGVSGSGVNGYQSLCFVVRNVLTPIIPLE